MTPEQQKSYDFHKMLGWEYSHHKGDCVIVSLWRQDTMESRSLFAQSAIAPDGSHKCVEPIQNNFTPASADRETPPVVKCHDEAPTQTTRNGCGAESAGGELFDIPETKSPRLKWMERHHLTVYQNVELVGDAKYSAFHGMTAIGHGHSYDDALVAAAKSLNIKLWNE